MALTFNREIASEKDRSSSVDDMLLINMNFEMSTLMINSKHLDVVFFCHWRKVESDVKVSYYPVDAVISSNSAELVFLSFGYLQYTQMPKKYFKMSKKYYRWDGGMKIWKK